MAFDINKKAIAEQPVTLKLLDPEETLVYRTELRTSTFGIASADWQIPGNLFGGRARVRCELSAALDRTRNNSAGREPLPLPGSVPILVHSGLARRQSRFRGIATEG
jgi:hypothetical protein